MILPKVFSDICNLVSERLAQDHDREITSIVVGLREPNMIDEINRSREMGLGIEVFSIQGIPIIVDYRAEDGIYVLKNNEKFSPAKKAKEDFKAKGMNVSKTRLTKWLGIKEG